MKSRSFLDCSMSERLLFTAFLLLIGAGYLMALIYLYTTHESHDGKAGLSIEDIAANYYGNRSGTKLEAAIRGSMAGYIQTEDRYRVVKWLQSGAPEKDYQSRIRPIIAKTCVKCHSPASGLEIPDLSTYSGIGEVSKVDTGESLHTLMRLSHIHLLGIGLVLLGVGFIFTLAVLPPWIKYLLILTPFVAIFADVLAWFLTKWDPHYAYTVVTAGALLGFALLAQILISLYQIWLLRPPADG